MFLMRLSVGIYGFREDDPLFLLDSQEDIQRIAEDCYPDHTFEWSCLDFRMATQLEHFSMVGCLKGHGMNTIFVDIKKVELGKRLWL